jgi:hypothetical protein
MNVLGASIYADQYTQYLLAFVTITVKLFSEFSALSKSAVAALSISSRILEFLLYISLA